MVIGFQRFESFTPALARFVQRSEHLCDMQEMVVRLYQRALHLITPCGGSEPDPPKVSDLVQLQDGVAKIETTPLSFKGLGHGPTKPKMEVRLLPEARKESVPCPRCVIRSPRSRARS